MSCTHTPPYASARGLTEQAAAAGCTIVESHSELVKAPRAVTIPQGNRTLIQREFWDSIGPMQRAAVVAHERAHVVIGLDCPCESCADKVGGYLMRMWGYTDEGINRAFSTLRVGRERNLDGTTRDAARGALEGAKRATQARALTGNATLDNIMGRGGRAQPAPAAVVNATVVGPELVPLEPTIPTPRATEATQALTGAAPAAAPVVAESSADDALFSKDVRNQIIAGVVAALVLAVILGRGA